MSPKPSQNEDEFIAREEAEKKRKLALTQVKELAQAEKQTLKDLHYMHCPKCGMQLHTIGYHGVEVDKCFNCHGVWLDDGELEKLAGKDKDGYWARMLRFFARKEFGRD
jgi:uncharacterized protein